jgi:GNAT superfamily N-acetyltransferase
MTLRIVPANEASWDDIQDILTGGGKRCQCERERLGDHDWFRMPESGRADLFRSELHCDDPRATETIGIVGYLDGTPVAWAAVDRRAVFGRLRGSPVPWEGRSESKDDDTVWAVPCLFVRKGHRGQGLTHELVAGAVAHARERGAAALEGYPMRSDGRQVIWDETRWGFVNAFAAAGFEEVSQPTKRRVVMRLEL